MSRVQPFGESAFLVEVDGAEAAQGLRRALVAESMDGVTGVVPGRVSDRWRAAEFRSRPTVVVVAGPMSEVQ